MNKLMVYLSAALFLILSIAAASAIPNPAFSYCENMGYEIVSDSCVFDDGNACDAWAFYNGTCGLDYVIGLECRSQGQSLEPGYFCCNDLMPISRYVEDTQEGLCAIIQGSYPICSACGDGICKQFENECNCAIDCTDIPLIPEFGTFVGILTVISAIGVFFFVRKN